MALISEHYRRQNATLHAMNPNYGAWAKLDGEKVRALIAEVGAATVLDYGCGKGTLAEYLKPFPVQCYDPAVRQFSGPAEAADLVVCRDVMEHVEPDCVDDVLRHIAGLTLKAAWFVISCRPAEKQLPDGRNAHVCIQPPQWWQDRLAEHFATVRAVDSGDELEALCL